jgi:hypothetical protein
MVVGGRHEGQKKVRIEYFQTKVVAMECGGRVLTGRLENVRPLLHVPGLLENALVAVALQAAEYAQDIYFCFFNHDVDFSQNSEPDVHLFPAARPGSLVKM